MIFGLVRSKGKSSRPNLASILTTALISGLLVSIPVPANAAACVPTSTTATNGDTILTFSTVGTCDWTVPTGVTKAQVLIVGGGGGGGDSKSWTTGGGGGSGGYFQATDLSVSGLISITVGAGGAAGANNTATTSTSRGSAGGDSAFGTLKVGGGGGGNSWNYTLGTAAMSGNGGATYLTGGNGGGARSRPDNAATTAIQNGGSGGANSSSGITFLGATLTGVVGVAGNNSNSEDYATGGTGGSVTSVDRTSSISGSSYEYSKPGPFKWSAGAQTYGSGGDAGYLGATDSAGGGTGFQGIVIVRYLKDCSPTRTTTASNYVYTFITVGQCGWSVPSGVTSFDALVVGGGGGGGSSLGGGGGGGQVVSQTSITLNSTATIWIGAGGLGGSGSFSATTNHGKKGSSSALVSGSTSYTALGGSGGNGRMSATNLNADGTAITTGYTGGGGAYPNITAGINSGTAIAGVGGSTYIGGTGTSSGGGGGGGAGGAGKSRDALSNAASGGVGVSSDISGSTTFYGGGGGASWYNSKTNWTGAGGNGGGGQGSDGNVAGGDGAVNTGGGGGGAYDGLTGGDGGSGIVIISHPREPSTVSYNINGGNGSAPSTQTQSTAGQILTVASYSGTKNSLRFMNWNTAADGSGINYAAGGSIRPTNDTILYAQWMGAYCPENWTWTEPTCTKTYSGQQNFVIPWGFKSLDVIAIGGSGANGAKGVGGVAGKIQASYSFTQGDDIRFFPGGSASGIIGGVDTYPNANYNGGNGLSNNGGSGGGGAGTVVTKNGTATSNVIIIAGGGGGGGANNGCYSQYNPITSTPGNPAASSNGFTYGTDGASHGYNMYSGAGGGGANGGKNGGATAAYSCSSGNDNGGLGLGGYRGGNAATGATTIVSDGANSVNAVAGSVILQLTRPVINYNLNGATGTAPAKQVQSSEGEDLVVAAVGVTRAGYTFGGWYTAANATGTLYTPGDLYNTNAVITLYAKWTSTITFSGNSSTGGLAPETITVLGANTTVLPTNTGTLARTNFIFDGWNTAANGAGTHYATGATYTTTGDVTLYARWNSTITYNGNGNTGGTAPVATTAKGTAANTTLANLGNLVKTGATFAGWNTLQDGTGTTYAGGLTTYAASGSVTLYAKWIVSAGAPTLATSSDLGSSNTDKITSDNTPDISVSGVISGASVEVTATPASGSSVTCTFVASSTTGTCTFSTLPDGTYSFTAKQTYNGGTSTASAALAGVVIDTARPTVTLSSSVVSGANDLIARNNAITNYTITVTFSETVSGLLIGEITKDANSSGWTVGTTLSGSGNSYTFTATNSGVIVNSAGKLLLRIAEGVASDVAGNTNVATVNDFVINSVARVDFWDCGPIGQYCTGGTGPASITQSTSGASITLPGANTLYKTGHTFIGWGETQNSTTVLSGSYTPSTRIILFPLWSPNTYVVTYNANGGNGAPATASQSFTFGSTALVPSAIGTLTRNGYTFGGWSVTAVASGTIYSNPNDTVAGTTTKTYSPTASITLYAKWSANSYTLSYNGNGGSTSSSVSITAGTPVTLATTAGTRTGYTLQGWNTAVDGSGTSLAGGTSQTYYSNMTLYALWRPVAPGAPSVTAATSGNTTATATVTGVAASGTTVGPATSYSVQAFDSTGTTAINGKTCTVLASATPLSCEITGLTNGTTYKFKATAINTTGTATGAASTVTAIPAPYVVTYSLNGGSLATTTVNYTLGTPLILPLPTKTGNSFTGWNNPSNASVGVDGASYSPPATITLTAQWSANTYTITYNGNGSDSGTVTAAASFTFGNSYSIAAKGTMTKSGYNFAGWTVASNGTGTVYANATDSIASSAATYTAANNVTLYAKWTPQVYVITYNANGATGSPSRATDSFTFGSTPVTLPDKTGLTYAGYTFVGWSETTSGTTVVNPYSPTQTRTLYAIWAGISYSISYNVNGGTGSVADATYTTGATGITLNDGASLSRFGYAFAGWKNVAGTTVSTSAYTPTDNVTVYAIWNPKPIAVTYDRGIATTTTAFPSATTVAFGANLTLSSGVDVSTTISSTNYLFAGWQINGVTYKSGDTYRVSSEAPITVTAQWLQLFDVRYNVNGGTLATDDLVTDGECVTAGLCINTQVITLNAAPTRAGYTFNGWNNQGGTLVADSDPVLAGIQTGLTNSNYIFYASWTANTYTITFAAGTGSNGNAQAITDSHGAIVQLAASTGYSLTGSVFTGWLIGGVTYPAGAFYTMGTNASPITATAQYANNTFKIFYNTNGATSGVTPTATSAVQGANITFNDATGFSRTGYTFEGWSDGTAVRAAGYATTMGSANATVIAQWKIAIPATPTITSVTGSDGGATITVAAAATGGAPSSYVVTASPGGATCTVFAPATTCSISPLTNGTAYTFSVTASNSTGTSAAATSGAVTPAAKPDAPTGVVAVRGNTQATVSLTAVTGIATGGPAISSYTITAYDANNNAVGTPCQTATGATSCVVTGLTNGTPYTFKATANNGILTSSPSAASTAVIPATVPNAPTSVSAAVTTAGAATVSFTAPLVNGGSTLTGFTVTSSPGGFTCTAAANATSCVVSGLTNGTVYTFIVVATNEIGNSVASSATSAVTPQAAATPPSTITATAGDGQATIAFSGATTNGSTIVDYTVQAYDSNGNAVSGATCTSATSPCTITGLANGSTYTFKVVTNSTVYGAASTTASTPSIASNSVTPATAPSAPTGVEVTSGTGKVTVSWTAAASNGSPILSYQVQAYDGAGNAVTGATCTATAPATTCDVSANLVAGTNYTFKVTATSAAGTSTASTASSAVAVNAAPSVPLSVTAVAANASATVSWGSPANINGSAITGYSITAYDANNNVAGTCTSVAPATTCIVNGLTNGTPYTFKATATNGIGTSSESSASSAVTPSTIPNAPTGVTASMGDAQATISFIAPANNGGASVTSYTVTSNPGNFTCTVNAPATSCIVTGLTNGTAYTFTVRATNKNGESVASTASTSGTPVLSSPPTLVNPGQPTGNPYVGSTLTSNVTFSGSPTPTVTYQWKVCTDSQNIGSCTDISGATSATYTPTISELGKFIIVEATATNRVGSLTETSNPTLVIEPEIDFSAPSPIPSGTAGTAYVLSTAAAGGVGTFAYTVSSGTLPAGVSLDPATGQIFGTPTTAGTYTFTVRATDSNGVYKDVVITITIAAQAAAPVVVPTPTPATCDATCQAAADALAKAAADKAAADKAAADKAASNAAAAAKAAADKAAADALAKAAADKAAADKAAAEKLASDIAASAASTKAAADAAAAAAAATAAIDKAAAAAVAQAAADAAAKIAADQAKAAADARAAAAKAAADAATALKNSTTTAAAKAAATASANKAAADAAAAVKAAATAAQQAATAKTAAANATKQVDIAINSLNSKTAASQSSAQANVIAAAAKTAADAAAKSAADAAVKAKTAATAAQKAASDTAARIATEQKQAADAAAAAKIAADAAAKATAERVAAEAAATKAAQDLAKVLADKAALAEQAAKAANEAARAEIQKKIDEVKIKAEEVQKTVEAATTKVEAATTTQISATENAVIATKEAQTQAAEAVAVKAESIVKNTEATTAAVAATVAAKVATAAKAAAAKVPGKVIPNPKPSTSTSKNSATATVTGLKPGQKIKVTVNVKGK